MSEDVKLVDVENLRRCVGNYLASAVQEIRPMPWDESSKLHDRMYDYMVDLIDSCAVPKPAVGPATRAAAEAVAAVRADKRRDRQLIVECGGCRYILSGATADAFLAELEADR
jgi:hypothetical protein